MEELGEDATDKNHVLICRALLARYGLDPVKHLDDELCIQALMQLALACNAKLSAGGDRPRRSALQGCQYESIAQPILTDLHIG